MHGVQLYEWLTKSDDREVWLQTEFDDTKSCYQFIIIITNTEKQTGAIWKTAFKCNYSFMVNTISEKIYMKKALKNGFKVVLKLL